MQRVSELMYGQVLAAMATDGIFYIVICLMATKLCNLLPGIAAIAGQFVMAGIWSAVAHRWYYKAFPPQPTTVVYDVRRGMEKLIQDYGLDSKYEVKKVLSVEECLEDLSVLDGMKTVFLSGVHSHERNIILKYCVMNDINTFIIPRVGDVLMSGAWPMHMLHLPVLRVGRYMAKPEYLFVKRAMDIVLSLIALIVLSPLFLITAIAVKSDGGPDFAVHVHTVPELEFFHGVFAPGAKVAVYGQCGVIAALVTHAVQPGLHQSFVRAVGALLDQRIISGDRHCGHTPSTTAYAALWGGVP